MAPYVSLTQTYLAVNQYVSHRSIFLVSALYFSTKLRLHHKVASCRKDECKLDSDPSHGQSSFLLSAQLHFVLLIIVMGES